MRHPKTPKYNGCSYRTFVGHGKDGETGERCWGFQESFGLLFCLKFQGFETCSVCHKVASRSSLLSVEVVRFQMCVFSLWVSRREGFHFFHFWSSTDTNW